MKCAFFCSYTEIALLTVIPSVWAWNIAFPHSWLFCKGSLLLNIARGHILDYESVYQSLKLGHLGGLGLDVAWQEPFDPDDKILKFPNVIITPHVAGVTEPSYRTMAKVYTLLYSSWIILYHLQNCFSKLHSNLLSLLCISEGCWWLSHWTSQWTKINRHWICGVKNNATVWVLLLLFFQQVMWTFVPF